MELLNYINTHSDWETRLAAKPYCLDIKTEFPYTILKYRMLESDYSKSEVLQARGIIIRQDNAGQWFSVSYAMSKFFNATEPYACTKDIDWTTARVLEKVDGSLCKLAFDPIDQIWLFSTNGSIFGNAAMVNDTGMSFYDLFVKTIGGAAAYSSLLDMLDKNYTYFFELATIYNKICVSYKEDGIYYLGRRDMRTLEEDGTMVEFPGLPIKYPRSFSLNSLAQCNAAAEALGENVEGFVVCDNQFHRVKIKCPWYISMHRLRGNGPITPTHIISLWQEDALDDFIAAFPEAVPLVEDIKKKLTDLIEKADIAYDCVKGHGPRREFALRAQSYVKPIASYLFARLDEKTDCASTYFKQMKPRNLAELIDVKDIGIK